MGLMGADWHSMGASYTDAAFTAVVASFGVAVQRRGGWGALSTSTLHAYVCVSVCVCICMYACVYVYFFYCYPC